MSQRSPSQSESVVLLVEDDRDDFFVIEGLLRDIKREKHKIVWATSFEAAKSELEERHIDVALVDYRIDGRTGIDFIAQVGALFPHCPMILLTGLRDPDIDLAAERSGAVDYLVKDELSVEGLDRAIRYARKNTSRWSLLDAVLANASAGVVSLDADERPVFWNAPALDVLSIVPPRDGRLSPLAVTDALNNLKVRGRLPEELELASGRSLQVCVNPAPGGGSVVVLHDITTLKTAERYLLQAAEQASAASVAKSNFLATMSHELRTPLNGILGMVRVLAGSALNNTQRDHLEIIKDSGQGLLRLINDILDLSKIEAGKVEIEDIDFDLPELIENAVRLLAPTAYQKSIELTAYVDPRLPANLNGDPNRIRQVLINIIGNAIKFTDQGHVSVAVDYLLRDTRPFVKFSVRDTGCGIDADKVEHLFARFSQLDSSTTRTHGGTGLGLALCKELVTLMQGEISYAPSPEARGSEFSFLLPLPSEHEAVQEARRAVYRNAVGARILVLTAQAAVNDVISKYGKAVGADVRVVVSQAEVVGALLRSEYQMLIVDLAAAFDFSRVLSEKGAGATTSYPTLVGIDPYPGSVEPSANVDRSMFSEIIPRPVGPEMLGILATQLKRSAAGRSPPARPMAATSKAAPASQPVEPLRILLAEDNGPNRMVASALLTSSGYDLTIVEDGLKVVEQATSSHFDVVLMDVQMPGIDGIEATRRIRAHPKGAGIPIIGLTAGVMKSDRDRCLNAGMSDYQQKPVDWDHLLRTLALIDQRRREVGSARAASG